jgi:hypothetical protein
VFSLAVIGRAVTGKPFPSGNAITTRKRERPRPSRPLRGHVGDDFPATQFAQATMDDKAGQGLPAFQNRRTNSISATRSASRVTNNTRSGGARKARSPSAILTPFVASSLASAISIACTAVVILIPSGMDCDTGDRPGACVRADATATFVAAKRGFAAPGAREFTGAVHVVGIGAPAALLARFGISPAE